MGIELDAPLAVPHGTDGCGLEAHSSKPNKSDARAWIAIGSSLVPPRGDTSKVNEARWSRQEETHGHLHKAVCSRKNGRALAGRGT